MDKRIQQYLDGELSFEDLGPEERPEARRQEALHRLVVSEIPAEAPDLTDTVMDRVAELPSHSMTAMGDSRLAALLRWLWTPRPLQIAWRPAFALAGAALATAVFMLLPANDSPPAGLGQGQPAQVAQILVQFRLDAPDASSVALAGDFTGWEPSHELRQNGRGVWSIVVPLDPGIHDYAFVVDGERWTPDPLAMRVDDGFGGWNSRFSLFSPAGQSS